MRSIEVRFAAVLALSLLILMACGAGGSGVTVGKKIVLLLPETPTRFDTKDKPYFEAKLSQLCRDCQVLYSHSTQDAAQQAQAKTAITGGASVIVLDPINSAASAAIVAEAKAAHIPVISYDGLILNTADLNYYVSFDDGAVGTLQGAALVTALGTKTHPTVVEINGDSADKKAELFKAGAHKVLDGKVHFAKEYSTPGWMQSNAQAEMQQALVALGRTQVDGVLAANDSIADGAIAAMRSHVLKPLPPVTGQGADLAAIQRIVSGDQYMTVYDPIKVEAETAAQLAYDLAFGVAVPFSMTNGKTVNNGTADIPSVLMTPEVVTKANIESTVVADGFWAARDICTAQFIAACAAAGIS
jgi:D-xylose transport system substrate-binding protein